MALLGIPYTLSRSTIIDAPPEKVFDAVRDFNTWNVWSPWLCTERTAEVKITSGGTEVGDVYSWSGDLVGAGEIEHTVIEESNHIEQQLRFIKPFKSVAKVWFDFSLVDGKTEVVWGMESEWPIFLFFMKKMMVAMIGNDYERGLVMLKDYVETGKVEFDMEFKGIVDVPEEHYVGITTEEPIAELKNTMPELFPRLEEVLQENGIEATGKPFSIYHIMDFATQRTKYTCAIPVAQGIDVATTNIKPATRPTAKALKVVHTGDYRYIGNSWMGAYSYIFKTKGIKLNKSIPRFEVYLNDSRKNPPKEWQTAIYVPVK